jgi:hypothetical protein
MLIEELIRLGRPLVEGGLRPEELVRLITDVASPNARNFYRHVFVVELPAEDSGVPVVLPMQVWGNELDGDFQVDVERAVGAPILLPGGGNPLNPQGRYGIPVYPCWDAHFQAFRESAEAALEFLRGRVERTLNFAPDDRLLQAIAEQLHHAIAAVPAGPRERWLGVLVLARPLQGGIYNHAARTAAGNRRALGESRFQLGRIIVSDLARILEQLWAARIAEGAEEGRRPGPCSFLGEGDEVVSPYCTVWPWAFLTWTCPLPHAGTAGLIGGIGLAEPTYRALTAGACVFRRLTRLVHPIIVHELFCPAADREGRNVAQRRSLSDLPRIYGSAFLLPLEEGPLGQAEVREEFAAGVRAMLREEQDEGSLAERHLASITGFDAYLPEEFDSDQYRLTLVYFSGEPSRGDIHLRAYIQDVIPTTVGRLRHLARQTAQEAVDLLRLLIPTASERQQGYYQTCYRSVPYLLARAYGGSHLWTELERVLHRRPLDLRRITANAAARMTTLVPRFPESRFEILDEVIFYLSALVFVRRCNQALAGQQGDESMTMRPWPELLTMVERGPLEDMQFCPDSPSELGFACGVLLRQFSRWYWMATRVGTEGKDYLRHRVLTFGTDLAPAAVRSRGLAQMFDLARRIPGLHLPFDFQSRVGVVMHEFDNRERQVRDNRDSFMAAFWSGYALQGAGRPPEETGNQAQATTGAQT